VPTFDFRERVEGKEPYTIILDDGGDDIVLPAVLPAKTLLVYMNMSTKDMKKLENMDEQTAIKLGIDLIEGLMSHEEWDRLTSRVGLENINDLALEIFDYYGLTSSETKEEEEGREEKVDPSPTSKSSSTSEPSTQTLNGSTPKQDEDSTMELLTTDSSSSGSETYLPRASS
jgi:hypothetical protein